MHNNIDYIMMVFHVFNDVFVSKHKLQNILFYIGPTIIETKHTKVLNWHYLIAEDRI